MRKETELMMKIAKQQSVLDSRKKEREVLLKDLKEIEQQINIEQKFLDILKDEKA